MMVFADIATLRAVIEETFTALGVKDNEAALIEIERLQAIESTTKEPHVRKAITRARAEHEVEAMDRAALQRS